MVTRALVRPVAAVLFASALGAVSMPVKAALVYTDCLEDRAGLLTIPAPSRSVSPGLLCVDRTQLGDGGLGEPPSGEYQDVLTGVVYSQTSAGLEPIGVALEHQGYAELTAHAWGGASSCASTQPILCVESGATTDHACSDTLCEAVHVSVVGCYDVQVVLDFGPQGSAALGGQRYEVHDYPPPGCDAQPMTYASDPAIPALVTGAGFFGPVTVVADAFHETPSCWLAGSALVPQSVTSTLTVGDRTVGSITNPICP